MSDIKSTRKAPKKHAKEFKLNTIKKGLDGEYWIVKKRKDGVKVWKKNNTKQKGGNKKTPYCLECLNELNEFNNNL